MSNFDDMKLAVQALSGGTNTVILDDIGMPSIMVVLPQYKTADLIAGATQTVHPAFIVNGVEKKQVAISKYINVVMNNRAYSLPFQDPRANIDFDTSLAMCRNKGDGWGLTPMSLWSAIALWCKKNNTQPRGNNNWGSDVAFPHERGVGTTFEADGRVGRTATGSGPATWNHNWMPDGISDMNGNIWEWQTGMRLVMGEIQIIPYANCMSATCDMGTSSTEWKAINKDGALVAPGSANTLKLDFADNKWVICTTITSQLDSNRGALFQSTATANGIVVPQILKELTLFPADVDGYEGDYYWANNGIAERLPFRGGNWANGAHAGVFYTYLHYPRSNVHSDVGLRSAFYGDL